MKKLLIALVSLLVCSMAFASTSVTAGVGYGSWLTILGDDSMYYNGPAVSVSVDHEIKDSFSVYGDFAFNYLVDYKGKNIKPFFEKYDYGFDFALDAGCGNTFYFGDFSIMIGGGLDIKCLLTKEKDVSGKACSFILGLNARLKGTYQFNEKWGLSAVITYAASNLGYAYSPANGEWSLGGIGSLSWNALIGATYKF